MQITIKDKKYELSWGLGAIEIYCDTMECNMEGLSYIDDPSNLLRMQKALVVLVLAAIQNAKEIAREEMDISYRELQAWLSEIDQAEFKGIIDDFIKSKYLGKTIGEYIFGMEPDDKSVKKKSRSAKS